MSITRYIVDEAYDCPGLWGVRKEDETAIKIIGVKSEAEAEALRLNDALENESGLSSLIFGIALGLWDRLLGPQRIKRKGPRSPRSRVR